MKEIEWIRIKCLKCGHSGNYLPTISGTDKCTACHKIIHVPRKEVKE